MPSSLPDAPTLMKAATKYLENELLPELSGYHRFKTRVTINVLATIGRELELRDENIARERSRLSRLLGHEGDLEALNEELCGRIRDGAIAADDAALREHVRESLREALAINNPRWLS
ncbi:MAG: DUF6285 domain-containing protein [Candidatus Binataceae bacterium]